VSSASVDSTAVKQSPIVDVEVEGDLQPEDSERPSDEALRAVIEKIRPAVQADGGDISFHGIDEHGVVTVELSGACVSCPASTMTLKAGVERILKDRVPGVTSVINLGDDDETLVSL
jgi:Fe-S cluster biogenesis protein NfuA